MLTFNFPWLLPSENESLKQFWSDLNRTEQHALYAQIDRIDPILLQRQRDLLHNPTVQIEKASEPFDTFAVAGNQEDKELGKSLIAAGRLGCVILAGGDGTRLRFNGPKGCYPISVVKGKSLFQLLAEKCAAASRQAQCALPLAIMTSPNNDAVTRKFFQTHNYFGLDPSQVSFFSQDMLPLLNAKGELFLETPARIAEGPDGNGRCWHHFVRSGIWEKWQRAGIEYIHLVQIDNPLTDPFDAELLGYHVRQNVEVTLKCAERTDSQEKVGLVVRQTGSVRIVEYSEMSTAAREARDTQGHLLHRCANLGLFCLSMPFIHRFAQSDDNPLHRAWKAARYVDKEGNTTLSGQPIAWKFETFIFDLLAHTARVAVILYPREDCFAPLKQDRGADSPDTVRIALQRCDQKTLRAITGYEVPLPLEVSADFYYPTDRLLDHWRGHSVITSYVEP